MLGSLSKTLSPALGIGWAVAPPAWTRPFRATVGPPAVPSPLDQLTFAAFLEPGAYDRHLRAARKRFRLRRDRLVRGLAERLPDARLLGVAAGLRRRRRPRPGPRLRQPRRPPVEEAVTLLAAAAAEALS